MQTAKHVIRTEIELVLALEPFAACYVVPYHARWWQQLRQAVNHCIQLTDAPTLANMAT